jgi:chorismate mutase
MSDQDLSQLREKIDALDVQMHQILMQRGEIIEALINAKKLDVPVANDTLSATKTSAFRPMREASMMQALAARHHGSLPFETVESIWRVMIGTFTYLQSPYMVHGDTSCDINTDRLQKSPLPHIMRDMARFHFGFSVPYQEHTSAAAVIQTLSQNPHDLGLIMAKPSSVQEIPWWTALEQETAPKIIALLPFSNQVEHPAGRPTYVICANPTQESIPFDCMVWSVNMIGLQHAPALFEKITSILPTQSAARYTLDATHISDTASYLLYTEVCSVQKNKEEDAAPLWAYLEQQIRTLDQASDFKIEIKRIGGHAARRA